MHNNLPVTLIQIFYFLKPFYSIAPIWRTQKVLGQQAHFGFLSWKWWTRYSFSTALWKLEIGNFIYMLLVSCYLGSLHMTGQTTLVF